MDKFGTTDDTKAERACRWRGQTYALTAEQQREVREWDAQQMAERKAKRRAERKAKQQKREKKPRPLKKS